MVKSSSYLLDTHIFIWWMEKNERSLGNLIGILADSQNLIFLSVASIWEMVIKRSKNKLKVPQDIESGIKASGFDVLAIETSHALETEKLPNYHQDPFDRMLVAQAIVEKLTIITKDEKIKKYDVGIFD